MIRGGELTTQRDFTKRKRILPERKLPEGGAAGEKKNCFYSRGRREGKKYQGMIQ